MLTKQLALEDERTGIKQEPSGHFIQTDGLLDEGRIPRAVEFKKGPKESFQEPPKPLKPSEY